jgi:hypothetical protein
MYTEDEYAGIKANAGEMEAAVSSFIRAESPRGCVRVPKRAKTAANHYAAQMIGAAII